MNVEIDISDVKLYTKDLILRPWNLGDVDDFFEYASVDGVGQMAGWLPHQSKDESLFILNKFIEHKRTFALVYQNKVIGSLGIEKYKEDVLPELSDYKARELGFVLSKDYWGRGLMKQAVDAVIDYLFNEINLDVIVCCHFSDNRQSQRLQEKCGFKPYKTYIYDSHIEKRMYGEENDNRNIKDIVSVVNLLWKNDYQKLSS